MHTTPTLATRFAHTTFVLRSDTPLTEAQMRQTAPSIFAPPGKHARSSTATSRKLASVESSTVPLRKV